MSTPARLLETALSADPTRPLVTFYDDASGERVELSVKTFANWVAKTANLLTGELMAEPGERVALVLPPHWQTAVWLTACWSAGLVVVPADPANGRKISPAPDILVAGERVLLTAMEDHPDAREVVGLSLHALGAPMAECPPGVTDYALEVRAQGDHFAPQAADEAGLELADASYSGAELVAAATGAATRWDLGERSRVLTTMAYVTLDGIMAGWLAPLASRGSVIICQNLDESNLDRRISMEHVTDLAGIAGPDDPSQPAPRLA